MSGYTYQVRSVDMKHRGGTKEYHLLQVERSDGQAIAIARWNGVGKWGQIQVEKGSHAKISRFFAEKLEEKSSRSGGYVVENHTLKRDLDSAGMMAALGRYQAKLDRSVINFLLGKDDGASFESDDEEHEELPAKHVGTTAEVNSNWGTW